MPFELTEEEGKFLIKLARNTVETFLKTRKTLKPPKDTPQKLYEKCGVFVTISTLEHGEKKSTRMHRLPLPNKPPCRSRY
jgi:uncharacterized protein